MVRNVSRGLWLVTLLGAVGFANALADQPDPLAQRFGGPFALVTHDKRPVTEKNFHGRFMLVQFGYTHCPDICPTTLADLTVVMDELGALQDRVQPLFITVDPARDTPDVLAEYRASFHPSLVMLTGTELQIRAVAKAYRVHRRKYLLQSGATDTANDYGVDHGSLTYLMGPDGTFRTLIPYGTPPEKIVQILRSYLAEASPGQ